MIPAIPDVTLVQLLQRIAAVAIVLGVYGALTTWLVRRAGDAGPQQDGRQTVNPLAHLDLLGLAGAIFFRTTWMKALDVDPTAFKAPRLGAASIVIGSSVGMLLVSVAALALRPLVLSLLDGDGAIAVSGVLATTYEIGVATALLNLIPLPPLTGTLWLALVDPALVPRANRPRVRVIGSVVLVIGLLYGVVAPPLRSAASALRGVAGF
jgi:hypothetical protein